MMLYLVLALVALQRLGELFYAERNTHALLERGAFEVAPRQHRLFISLHTAWLVSMALFIPPNTAPNWWV